MTRPPFGRWLAAATLLAVAGYMDMTGPPTEPYPFVAEPTEAGAAAVVEWRDIPTGILPPPGAPSGLATTALRPGTPLLNELVAASDGVPDDWWALPAELPVHAAAGSELMIMLRSPDRQVAGIVVEAAGPVGFGGETEGGLIAVSAADAAAVAAALAERRATILIRP